MKFSVDAKDFLNACTKVQKAAASKTTLPVLSGVLVKTVNEEKITLCCYDLEFAISTEIKAFVEEEGAMCIISDTLINILKMLDGCITFSETGKQKINISGLNSNYTLMSFDVNDFPALPTVETEESFDISQKDFSDMIKQTIFAVSEDATKGAHTGVKFEVEKDNLRLVALDGYRFAVRNHPITYYDTRVDFVVPKKTLSEVSAIASSKDGEMSIEKCKQHVIFTIGDYQIISKLQSGDFLDYNRAMPKEFSFEVKVGTKDFIDNINRCAVIISDKVKSPLRLNFSTGSLRLEAETPIGNVKANMDIDYSGNDFLMGINHKFIKEALEACKEEEKVTMSFCSPTSPVVINAPGKTYLILAVRI